MTVSEYYQQSKKRFPVLVRGAQNKPTLWLQPGAPGQLWLHNRAGFRRLRGDEQVQDLLSEAR
jgi:hypothetical protein